VGIGLAIFIFVRTFVGWVDRINDLQRVDVPGQGTVALAETGGYTIYHEFIGADDRFFGPDVSQVTLTGPDGSDVPLRDYDSTVTYSNGTHDGVALFSFTAAQPGQYELSASGDRSTLAVGRSVGGGLVAGIVGGIAVGLLGVLAAIVIAIVVGVARGRSRRRQVYGMGPPGTLGPPQSQGPGWTPQVPAGTPWAPSPSPQDQLPPQAPPPPPPPPPPPSAPPASDPWVPPTA